MEEITFKKHHKKSGIYMLKWPETEYIYIGQSLNIHSRVSGHIWKIKNGIHDNKKINDISKKHGTPKCYLVCFCEKNELDKVEQKYLDLYFDGCRKCLNVLPTASSPKGFKMPPRSKEYIEKVRKRMTGRVVSKETLERMSLSNKGKRHTEEAKIKMSMSRKGKKFSEEHKNKIRIGLTGRIFSDKHKENIGKTKIGNKYTLGNKHREETKIKISEARKKDTHNLKRFGELNIKRRKPVSQIDNKGNIVNVFESITDAGSKGFDRKSISQCIRGIRKKYLDCYWVLNK